MKEKKIIIFTTLNFADVSQNKIIPIPVKSGFCLLSQKWLLLTQAYNIVRTFGPILKEEIHTYPQV